MMLRGQLITRLPLLSLRACCSNAPSTSCVATTSPLIFRLSSRGIGTFSADILSLSGSRLVWVRGGGKDWQEAEEVKGARTKHSEEKTNEENSNGAEEPIKPMSNQNPPSKMKLFVVAAVLSMAITTALFSTLIASDSAADSAIPSGAPEVDFPTFAAKYLRTGEVQKITFVVGKSKAVATLYPGAIIDGRPAPSEHVVINYPHNPPQFWADVRKEESDMGISLSHGINIQLLNPVSGWRLLEFFLGCFILGWLFTQYGRLMMKRVAEQRAKQGMK